MKKDYSKYLKKQKCTIFLFHGVYKNNNYKLVNYTRKHLHENYFKMVLKKLSKKGKCISINEVHYRIKNNINFDDYSYAISFDDGFYNNFSVAIPILTKMKLPAVFYITYDFVNKGLASWTDQLEYILEKSKKGNFISPIGNLKFKNTIDSKIDLLIKIRKKLKASKTIDPYKFTDFLARKLNFKKNYKKLNFSLFKKMEWKHVKRIYNNELFTIGGHSKKHHILSYLNKKQLQNEIKISLDGMKKKIKGSIVHYSYPEGVRGTYGKREIKFLKKNGIIICPSAKHGVNTKNSNLFNLKRISVI